METDQQSQAAPAASPATPPTASTTNPAYGWDDKTLRYICDNAKLPGQVYVLADGQPKMAFRGGSWNSRMSLAPMVEEVDPDGTDYAKSSSEFVLGPVYLPTDDALFAQASANPGTEVSASPRGPSALHYITLDPATAPATSPAPTKPVTLAPEQVRHAHSVMAELEAEALAGVHDVESVAGKAWVELKALLHV